MRRPRCLLAALALGAWLSAAATPPEVPAARVPLEHLPALAGDYFPLRSRATGRDYHVYVRLPEGYDEAPGRRWPVVYLLDGDSLFPLLAPTHLFLHYDLQLPEAIVVGIAYGGFDPAVNRRRLDFTAPGPDAVAGEEGGAPAFLEFLADELLPETERRHRVDPSRRVLVGQSRSGYFVLWSALQAPDLFWGRIASNPSFAPARDALSAAPAPAQRTDLHLVLASGARDAAFLVEAAHAWQAEWQAREDRPWALHHLVLPEGTHAASIGEAYGRAMRRLFADEITAAQAAQPPR